MTPTSQKQAAARFVEFWTGKGYEKGQSQPFWLSLLREVFGISEPEKFITFEDQVHLDNTSFIDGYIESTHVMIEQKSLGKNLNKQIKQSDGSYLTPYEQAKRYSMELPYSMRPRWIVTCNFESFLIYDMEHPGVEPQLILLKDLPNEFWRLSFLVDDSSVHIKKEVDVSMAAGRIIGEIYDAFLKEYRNPEDPHSLRSLNILCVRLVFCLYAEDAGLFSSHSQFHDYLVQFRAGTGEMRRGLLELFDVLNTPLDKRDPYLPDDLQAFPYVNGGLFAEKDTEVPRFNERIASLLLTHASDDFDWSEISPTIFGGVFESTLNPETRRAGGMHYTSIENIHKVIDPLFLDDLKEELFQIKAMPVEKKRIAMAKEFQDKLASLKFLDPACGSGNFLTETYLSLRRLENEAIRIIYKGQMMIGEFNNPIKVSINQFYGIEINDFAVSVAMTALWIAEAQMLFETEKIVQMNLDFLPLKTYTNIHEGNALRMDWNEVIPASKLNYIMGNPPFIGASMMTTVQKADAVAVYGNIPLSNSIDYVGGWYHKCCLMMKDNSGIRSALVSTNSITQGEQVAALWNPLFERYDVHIDFAWRTFIWDSEASEKAHVHVVIIGFSCGRTLSTQKIFDGKDVFVVNNISPYLVEGGRVTISSRARPLCDVPGMTMGNKPSDGGNLILSEDEREALLKNDPSLAPVIRRYIGAKDFINNDEVRYCLWLKDVSPHIYAANAEVRRRLQAVRELRLASTAAPTRKAADTPYKFFSTPQTETPYLIIPRVSSCRRPYIPIGMKEGRDIAADSCSIVLDASIYHFGVLSSSVHMAWVKVVGGRLKSDFRYSGSVVYNNFPWPLPTEEQTTKIEATAQAILDARSLYPDSSLANLYDDLTMPPELRKAHRTNDAAVLEAYGFPKDATESDIVARLFKMYQDLTKIK